MHQMRLGVLILQASMETLLALFNHFPLFALMLRVKDPWRLPGVLLSARCLLYRDPPLDIQVVYSSFG
jgi:hypothetical protein